MKTNLSSMLAAGKTYIQSINNEYGKRVLSVFIRDAGIFHVYHRSLEFAHTGAYAADNG